MWQETKICYVLGGNKNSANIKSETLVRTPIIQGTDMEDASLACRIDWLRTIELDSRINVLFIIIIIIIIFSGQG